MSKNSIWSTMAIMSIFFVLMGMGVLTPAIQNIAEAFPDIPFTKIMLISTLPSLFIIPASVISGALAGSKVKYKTLINIGLSFQGRFLLPWMILP